MTINTKPIRDEIVASRNGVLPRKVGKVIEERDVGLCKNLNGDVCHGFADVVEAQDEAVLTDEEWRKIVGFSRLLAAR